MKLSTPFFLLLAAAGFVDALGHQSNDAAHRIARHHELARDAPTALHRRGNGGRCKPHNSSTTTSTVTTTKPTPAPTSADPPKSSEPASKPASKPVSQPVSQPASKPASKPTSKPEPENNSSGTGLIKTKGTCNGQGPHATKEIGKTVGPNGEMDFINCNIEKGWEPPQVGIHDIVVVDLDVALKDPNTPYKACSKYISLFKKYADQYNFPAIFLAAFSMQESGCNPTTIGGAGELGLMQVTREKCEGRDKDACMEPDFNIAVAAKYFANSLNEHGGNVLKTVGAYNGWFDGMSVWDATKIRDKCCRCQQNIDYLMQFFNAWCQNKNAYALGVGKYFNLNTCPHD